ncbi:MAG: Sec-independent protein translocase protein TatB [Desulfovibrio sp.]|uniref:Sec-independent protein translocase protein TatB n=1 Tax=Desulfovibrio sp. TaxID=885 RepID=UPI0039E5E081
MFGIGSTELLVILVVALIVLGPKSMANVSRTLGKALGEFRRVSTDFQRTLNAEAEEEEQKKRKKEAAKAAREAAEAEAAKAATQTAEAAAMSAAADGQKAQDDGTAPSQETPAAEAVLDTTAVHPDEATAHAPVEGHAAEQNSPEAATAAEQPQAATASGATTPTVEGIPVPPEGSPLAEALARTEAEAREAEARLAQTATVSDNGGKA